MIKGPKLSDYKHWLQIQKLVHDRIFEIFILSYYHEQKVEAWVKAIVNDCLPGKEAEALTAKFSEINEEIINIDDEYLRNLYQPNKDFELDIEFFNDVFISSTSQTDRSGYNPYLNQGFPQIPEQEVIDALLSENDFGYTPEGEINIWNSDIETNKYQVLRSSCPAIDLLLEHPF